MRVLIYHPGTIEEHIYETATVRFRDADDIRTIDTIELDRPVKGCCFGVETLSYILLEKFWYNTPFDQIVRKLVWMFYEEGSRGAKAIRPFLEKFIGFYTTDGYICYKVFDTADGAPGKTEGPPAVQLFPVNRQNQRNSKHLTNLPIENQWVGEVDAYGALSCFRCLL